MKLQQLLSYTRRAVDDYQMIQEGDRIAVGISGGKDSLTLLYALCGLRRFYPRHFDLEAITVDLGFPDFDLTEIQKLCEYLEIPYHIVPTQIGEIVFEVRKETNPCSLCAKMRKGAFNQKARELNCGKIAYAHHKDDVIETFLLSLIYEGRIHTFSPVTELDRTQITLIRPLIYVDEADIVGFEHAYRLPVHKNPCPADGRTKREFSAKLVRYLMQESPESRERIFTAILHYPLKGWGKSDICELFNNN